MVYVTYVALPATDIIGRVHGMYVEGWGELIVVVGNDGSSMQSTHKIFYVDAYLQTPVALYVGGEIGKPILLRRRCGKWYGRMNIPN